MINTSDNNKKCGGSATLFVLNKLESENTGEVRNGFLSVGIPVSNKLNYITNAKNAPASYQLPDHMLSGKAGLTYAVNQGLIRPANQQDIQDWKNAEQKMLDSLVDKDGNKIEKAPTYLFPGEEAYVVLKKFTYPGGLYGAHSVVFIIPKGVPLPEGNAGHSQILDINTASCLSPTC